MKATEEGKPASVKVSFKVKKTGKASKYSYVSKVNVVEDKYSIVSAAATGVKKVEVKLNKAVEAGKTVTVAIKKGTAARTAESTVNGDTITLDMAAKLTAGDYSVTVTGLEDTDLTASFNVAKDETLTSYAVSDNIVAWSDTVTTAASIKYAALNQYGEKMVANNPQVSCSFGRVVSSYNSATSYGYAATVASATKEGEIIVNDINAVLSILGTTGTVVLVDPTLGVTTTKTVTFSSFATATELEFAGAYHVNSASFKNISENDRINEYELLFTIKDQYGYEMNASKVSGLNVTIAGGLTGLDVTSGWTDRTVDGKDYVALTLTPATTSTGYAVTGDATLTIVNPKKGLLGTTIISVGKDVIIKSVNFTFENGVYTGQENELGYEITDADGNAVTDYATIINAYQTANADSRLRIERDKDGKAKFILTETTPVTPQAGTDRATTIGTLTTYWNKNTSSDYLVKTTSYNIGQERYAKTVSGIKADTVTSFPLDRTATYSIGADKIVLADQYSNDIDSTSPLFIKKLGNTTLSHVTGTAIKVVSNGCLLYNVDTTNNKLVVTPQAVGTATVYMSFCSNNSADTRESAQGKDSVTVSETNYDAKFTINIYDTGAVDTSTLKIKSINDGFTVKATTTTCDAITPVVTAMVGGKETVIPSSQWTIAKNENNTFTLAESNSGVNSKTATLTIQVTTWDKSNTPIETTISKEYTVSSKNPYIYKVTGTANAAAVSSASITSTASVGHDEFVDEFLYKDQYGHVTTASAIATNDAKSVTYKIELLQLSGTATKTGYAVTSNGLNSANVKFSENGTYKFKVTATTPDGSSKSITWTASVTGL